MVPCSQSESLAQNANSSQDQTLSTTNNGQVQEHQQSTVTGNQSAAGGTPQGGQWTANASQQEAGSTASASNLQQNQSVTVNDSVINVTFKQDNVVSGSTVTLGQSVAATGTTSSASPTPTKVVNVTVGSSSKQYTVTTDAAVTFNESQSVNTANANNVTQAISMNYTSNGQRYTVSIS